MVAKVETETRTTGCEFAKIEIYARRTGLVKLRSYEEKNGLHGLCGVIVVIS